MRIVATCAFLVASIGLSGCGASADCSGSCPGTYITASVLVNLPSSMGLKGVQATLTGPVTDTMSCQPYGMASVCTWSNTAPITAGDYLLQISAPGFQTMTFQVQVAVPRPSCQCVGASIEPATFSLSQSDATSD